MKAFVLVSLNEGNEQEFLEELKSMPEVTNAYILFGEWDILTEIELDNAEGLGTFVMEKLRNRKDVRLTSSLIVAGK